MGVNCWWNILSCWRWQLRLEKGFKSYPIYKARQCWANRGKKIERFGKKTLRVHFLPNLSSSWKDNWEINFRRWGRLKKRREKRRWCWNQRGWKIKRQKEEENQISLNWTRIIKQNKTNLDEETRRSYKIIIF